MNKNPKEIFTKTPAVLDLTVGDLARKMNEEQQVELYNLLNSVFGNVGVAVKSNIFGTSGKDVVCDLDVDEFLQAVREYSRPGSLDRGLNDF